MTISREKCLEMAKEAGGERRIYEKSPGQDHILLLDTDLEDLINRAYKEGQKDMRERAVKTCSGLYTEEHPDLDMANLRKRHRFVLEDCADAVRELEIE